jgi:HAD superfamily hydrolase (TIGR01509 family)
MFHGYDKMCNEMFTARKGEDWPRAYVFDCDGLLVDSTRAWEAAYRAVAAEISGAGARLDLERLHGASAASAAAALTEQLGREVPEELVQRRVAEAFAFTQPVAMPGARALAERLQVRAPLAVASNGPTGLVNAALRATGLLDFFTAVACTEAVPRPKPAPDVYQRACRCLAVDPSDAVALEDSLVGVKAAFAAGLFVVGVGVDGAARATVDLVVDSLADRVLLDFLGVGARAAR